MRIAPWAATTPSGAAVTVQAGIVLAARNSVLTLEIALLEDYFVEGYRPVAPIDLNGLDKSVVSRGRDLRAGEFVVTVRPSGPEDATLSRVYTDTLSLLCEVVAATSAYLDFRVLDGGSEDPKIVRGAWTALSAVADPLADLFLKGKPSDLVGQKVTALFDVSAGVSGQAPISGIR